MKTASKSSWQKYGSIEGNDQANTPKKPKPSRDRNPKESNLSPSQKRGALASDVQGKISLGWSTSDIIAYFLDPSGVGYKLYSGITKEEFQQAVAGIFSDEQYSVLLNYGNTSAGRTNGGSGSTRGSNSNQSAYDSGNPNAGPQFPPSVRS